MSSDSLLSPSSAPVAGPAPTEHVDVAEEHTETAAATVVVDPPPMKLAVELRLQIFGYVLVNEEGVALIVKIEAMHLGSLEWYISRRTSTRSIFLP
jgi:hypothetical protein